jgi:hypothetical protein
MPSQDEIMEQIVKLVGDGAVPMPLTAEIESSLRDRYYGWIVETKKGVSNSPQQIWEQPAGIDIQNKFVLIGTGLAVMKETKPVLNKSDCIEACSKVESESKCPHCPDPSI